VIICRQCGHSNESSDAFCGSCGAFLEWTGEQDAPPVAPDRVDEGSVAEADSSTTLPPPIETPTVQPSPDAGSSVSCPACATPNEPDRTFCRSCGERLVPEAVEPAVVIEPTPSRRPSVEAIVAGAAVIGGVVVVALFAALSGFGTQDSSSPPRASSLAPGGSSSGSAEPSGSTATTAPTTAGATVAPTPRPILFYAVRTDPATDVDNADLYAIDPETRVERRLTDDARPDSYPAWSPDGSRIAFDSRRGDGNRNIWVLEPDGSFTPLTDDARDDGYPTWSPDGSQVAFSVGSAREREIWVMNALDGDNARRLTSGADDILPSWSSSGLIAFERHVGTTEEIWVVDPAGGDATPLITVEDGSGGDPAWSPDGGRLAFSRAVDGVRQVFVVDADGQSGLESLTPSSTCDCEEPSWSPDGTRIAYMGPRSDTAVVRPMLVISASGGSATQLTANGLAPSWGS
jgi:Tol biopolymer transport system component